MMPQCLTPNSPIESSSGHFREGVTRTIAQEALSGSGITKHDAQIGRDETILDHLPLVKAIAARVRANLPVQVDLDDLIHAGILGLIDAVSKYDAEKKVDFHSYAKHRIKGAI